MKSVKLIFVGLFLIYFLISFQKQVYYQVQPADSVCVSATHIAFSSIRMERAFMLLEQSAATAASIAIDNNQSIHEISYTGLRSQLL